MVEEESQFDKSFRFLANRLEGGKDSYGKLMKEIVNTGVCCHCASCAAACDVLEWDEVTKRPKLTGKCTGCGICYNQCPQTLTYIPDLIGDYKAAYTGRNLKKIDGQDGGIVTALIMYGLDEGLFDGAIVTKKSQAEPWKPVPTLVTRSEDLMGSSGSVYVHSQTTIPLIKAIRDGLGSIAFVGTPCNINAISKMQDSPTGLVHLFMRANIFRIGLFCMDSFSYDGLKSFLEKNHNSWNDVEKCMISKGKFIFKLKNGETIERKVHGLNQYKSTSCNFCTDLTSELADISVGSVGSDDGWSTILVRNDLAHEILLDAADKGYLEIAPLLRGKLRFVVNLARMKKQSFYNIRERRTFVYHVPDNIELEQKKEVKPTSKEEILAAAQRKMVNLSNQIFDEKTKILSLTVINTSGESLEEVDINISNVKEFFELKAWPTKISLWYPFEELTYEIPIDDLESEVLIQLSDKKGLLLSRNINIQKLMERSKS
ncbi:MAG: NADP oxidoreductase [Candidatus Lokiarchaeota archaeon]|nr:NADP oxidoreductase [Candidatus Lokiarchaeota archaeon]